MKLIDKLNGDEELLKKFSNLMYSFTKDAARESFREYLKDEGIALDQWCAFRAWLSENGLDTYL